MLGNSFANNTSLKKIPEGLRNVALESTNIFKNCTALTEIPAYAQNMFIRTDSVKDSNKTTNLSYIFDGCINIKTIDNSIHLPSTIINYSGFFNNCTSLENLPETFWPEQYETDQIYVSNVCNNCISLSANIPAEKLWGNLNIQWNSVKAFANCNNIINYNDIPSTWK